MFTAREGDGCAEKSVAREGDSCVGKFKEVSMINAIIVFSDK